ncbi:MAG: DUF6361 family protein [Gemmatimonadota bacterium]|nr:DUF6361 family protein [Gemmatimonadota bacterium]
MQATLTWLDLTASDRDKMRRVLDLFNEQGTLDEMGLGNLRDAISDALFPGTSYIQTRLRYVLFIPWLYQRLETRRVRSVDVAHAARQAEVDLIGRLKQGEDKKGIIGVLAGHSLVRLPSSIYWSALTRWDIFRPQQSLSWYHSHFDALADGRVDVGRADDPGVMWSREAHWHPRMPEAPADFPREASFALTRDEADFLLGRLEERCAGTLLGWLARNGTDSPAEDSWKDPDALRAPQSIRDTIELARRFSLHVEGMPLLYNLIVAEHRREMLDSDDDGELISLFRTELTEWAGREAEEAQPFDPDLLWELVARRGGRAPHHQRRFMKVWSRQIAELDADRIADDPQIREMVTERELHLKGARARLTNKSRLMDWTPGVGVGRMDFRWVRVRQFLKDLHRGLAA